MEDLLPYYERELAMLRRSLKEFAAHYPKVAARLAISGEQSEDAHVERMLQSFALIAARISARIDDDYPELTEDLLEIVQPRYLRAFPSCSIAQIDPNKGKVFAGLAEPRTLPKGTEFRTKGTAYRFQSVYDVVLAPIAIEEVRYARTAYAPTGVSLPEHTTGVLTFMLAFPSAPKPIASTMNRMRVHVTGQREIVASAMDGLLLHAAAAFVESDGMGRWQRLPQIPIGAVGFDVSESMMGASAGATQVFSLLLEYFAFPEKFDFFDIDVATLARAAGSSGRVKLHLAIKDVHEDSWPAVRMAKLSAENFRLFCTPLVNLFKCDAPPIEIAENLDTYTVVPSAKSDTYAEIYSIDEVRAVRPGGVAIVQPLRSLLHGESTSFSGPYWAVRRKDHMERARPEQRTQLSLVGLDGKPMKSDIKALSLQLTCTNGKLPSELAIGADGGDLETTGIERDAVIVLLRRPTEPVLPPRGEGALWRVISHLTVHPIQLRTEALDEFKTLFRQFANVSRSQSGHIDGLRHLSSRRRMQWIVKPPCPAFVRGIEVELVVDEQSFAQSSLATFVAIMERFFAPYAPNDSFVQLVVISKSNGREIRRCEPREGVGAVL